MLQNAVKCSGTLSIIRLETQCVIKHLFMKSMRANSYNDQLVGLDVDIQGPTEIAVVTGED